MAQASAHDVLDLHGEHSELRTTSTNSLEKGRFEGKTIYSIAVSRPCISVNPPTNARLF
jgi:hypothetical protein